MSLGAALAWEPQREIAKAAWEVLAERDLRNRAWDEEKRRAPVDCAMQVWL
jgi:hypothetical protein